MIDEDTLRQRMQRIDQLVRQLDSTADAGVKQQSRELLQSVMDLHGEAIERMLVCLQGAGEAGEKLLGSLASDPVVSSVLLLYGLHPLDFETRVRGVVEKVRPALRSYGVDAELTNAAGGAVRIRLRGIDSVFTARTVKAAVEDELYAAAPDATSLVLLGLENFATPDFVPLEKIGMLATVKGD
jgi:Fe-S cluster biogenesis protein NfuA